MFCIPQFLVIFKVNQMWRVIHHFESKFQKVSKSEYIHTKFGMKKSYTNSTEMFSDVRLKNFGEHLPCVLAVNDFRRNMSAIFFKT